MRREPPVIRRTAGTAALAGRAPRRHTVRKGVTPAGRRILFPSNSRAGVRAGWPEVATAYAGHAVLWWPEALLHPLYPSPSLKSSAARLKKVLTCASFIHRLSPAHFDYNWITAPSWVSFMGPRCSHVRHGRRLRESSAQSTHGLSAASRVAPSPEVDSPQELGELSPFALETRAPTHPWRRGTSNINRS